MYALAIHPAAEREWERLDESVRKRFKTKRIKERLKQPRVAKDALHGASDLYKIKITTPQYRLAYHVNDLDRLVTVLAVTTRYEVYALLQHRSV